MAKRTIDERLKAAQETLKSLQKKQAAVLSRQKAVESREKRKQDSKKKILLGAYLLDRMAKDPSSSAKVLQGLEKFLVRPADREIFGLSVKAREAAESPSA